MNSQLLLENIRGVLMRLEETIIFSLIERAQFARNRCIYRSETFGEATGGQSLLMYLLRETETGHARMRRYTSPDEKPFCDSLPDPILPELRFRESPIQPNSVNVNERILAVYVDHMVPSICEPGDDGQYGSSAVADVACLQNLSHRIHCGMFVAESKLRDDPQTFGTALAAGDRCALRRLITSPEVEERLLRRVEVKARHYGQDVNERGIEAPASCKVAPKTVRELYREYIVPLTKDVEVEYLLQCKRMPHVSS